MQRTIIGQVAPDFKRDNETQEQFINRKIKEIGDASGQYLKKTGMKGFLLGLSGGIDSYTCAALLANAGLPLHLLLLPNGQQRDIADSRECADALKSRFPAIEIETVSIENAYWGVIKDIKRSKLYNAANKYALGNVQARLRMVEQYALNAGLLVAGTDHAAENVVGYFTKYGDGGTDFNPLDGMLKMDLYEIARKFDAPECVLVKKPAAGLGISENDEAELKISYQTIVSYLSGYPVGEEEEKRIVELYRASMHKRNLPASPANIWWKEEREAVCLVVAGAPGEDTARQIVRLINERRDIWAFYLPEGGKLASILYTDIKKAANSPILRYNIFNHEQKGKLLGAVNEAYGTLEQNLTRQVIVGGEFYYAQKAAEELLSSGRKVSLFLDGTEGGPGTEAQLEMIKRGIRFI